MSELTTERVTELWEQAFDEAKADRIIDRFAGLIAAEVAEVCANITLGEPTAMRAARAIQAKYPRIEAALDDFSVPTDYQSEPQNAEK